MQIDWVNVLATVTVVSVAVSAVLGAGSALAYKIMQSRQARTAEVVAKNERRD